MTEEYVSEVLHGNIVVYITTIKYKTEEYIYTNSGRVYHAPSKRCTTNYSLSFRYMEQGDLEEMEVFRLLTALKVEINLIKTDLHNSLTVAGVDLKLIREALTVLRNLRNAL